jgi:hypothetical protein
MTPGTLALQTLLKWRERYLQTRVRSLPLGPYRRHRFCHRDRLPLRRPPNQTGIVPGMIEPRRVSVLRGQVQTGDGAPLAG